MNTDDLRHIAETTQGDGMIAVSQKRILAMLDVIDAANNLARFVARSIDAGPITRNPSTEAELWRASRIALAKLEATP